MNKLTFKDIRSWHRKDLIAFVGSTMPIEEWDRQHEWIETWTKAELVDEVAKLNGLTHRKIQPKIKATWVPCSGVVSEGKYAHAMRDYCSSCAPFWEKVPLCPTGHRLTDTGYCKTCKIHCSLSEGGKYENLLRRLYAER